jgi:hypothetical protein
VTPYWSYLLAAVGIYGLWLAGGGQRAGWAVGLAAQLLWIAYAVVTRQWGFIISALAYGFVYARNLQRWKEGDHGGQGRLPAAGAPGGSVGSRPAVAAD